MGVAIFPKDVVARVDRAYKRIKGPTARGETALNTTLITAVAAGVAMGAAGVFVLGLQVFQAALLAVVVGALASMPVIIVLKRDAARTRKIEEDLPDLLSYMASSHAAKTLSLPATISIAMSELSGPLRDELVGVHQAMTAARIPFGAALRQMAARNDSAVLTRVCNMIAGSYERIGERNIHVALYSAAGMIVRTHAMEREKSAAVSRPMLTMIILYIFMLPIVTAVIYGMLMGILPMVGMVGEPGALENVLAALGVVPVYVFIQGCVGAVCVGYFIKKSAFYTFVLLCVYFVVYLVLSTSMFV